MENLDKEKNFVSAVVYIHDNPARTEIFLLKLINELEKNFLHSEIICVSDTACDEVLEAVRRASKRAGLISISALKMSSYHGMELAMTAGLDLAIGDFVFEFDSTLADFDWELVMKVYHRSMKGYDIVSAVPTDSQPISSRLFYYLFNKFSYISQNMHTERFRILSRRAINRISSMNKTIPYRKAIYMNCGFPIDTVEYKPIMAERSAEKTAEENRYRERLAVDALLLFTNIGYKIAMAFTSIMMLIAVLVGTYGAATYFASSPVQGWTTTICFMAFGFFALFAILTIIVKYLQIILNLVFKRKEIAFEGIEKMT